MEEFTPVLYVIARKDIACLNPGKLAAQMVHLGNDVTETIVVKGNASDEAKEAYATWKEDRTFGVTLSLHMTETEVSELLTAADADGLTMGIVNDPTYPMVNYYGHPFTVPMDTCYWLFVHKDCPVVKTLKKIPLHQ